MTPLSVIISRNEVIVCSDSTNSSKILNSGMVFNQAECSILVWYQDELGARFFNHCNCIYCWWRDLHCSDRRIDIASIKFSYLHCQKLSISPIKHLFLPLYIENWVWFQPWQFTLKSNESPSVFWRLYGIPAYLELCAWYVLE